MNLERPGLKKSFEVPSADEYIGLRVLCGLSAKDKIGSTLGLKNSMFFIGLRDNDGKLRAMGRIVMEEISQYITEKLPPTCFVSLFADVAFLYEKFNFVYSEKSKGMYLVRPKKI